MKKRISGLAVIILLISASLAWGATNRVTITTSPNIDDTMVGATAEADLEAEASDGLSTPVFVKESFDIVYSGKHVSSDEDYVEYDVKEGALTITPYKVGAYSITVQAHSTYTTTESQDQQTVTVTHYVTGSKTLRLNVTAYKPTTIHADEESTGTKDPTNLMEDKDGNISYAKKGVAISSLESKPNNFYTTATLPITYRASGLPKGLSLVPTNDNWTKADDWKREAEKGASCDITFVVSGEPTEAGIFKGIVLTVSNAAGTTTSKAYTIIVFDQPTVTTKKIPDITWGKAYSTTIATSGGLKDLPVSFDLKTTTDDDEFKKLVGFSFDVVTGRLFGTLASTDAKTKESGGAFEDSQDITIKLKFKPLSPAGAFPVPEGANEETYGVYSFDVVLKAVKPAIVDKTSKQSQLDTALASVGLESSDATGKINGGNGNEGIVTLYADGPGTFKWWVDNLPSGIESDSITAENDVYGNGLVLKTNDKNAQALKRHTVTVHVKNGVGEDKVALNINLGLAAGKALGIAKTGTLPSGAFNITQKVGDDATTSFGGNSNQQALPAARKDAPEGAVKLVAAPGPITWTAKNLPQHLKLSIDKSVSFDTTVYLLGSFDKAYKRGKYTITATNKVLGASAVVSGEVAVYDKPGITTKSLPALTLGKKYNAKIAVKNADSVDVVITASGDKEVVDVEGYQAPEITASPSDGSWVSKDFKLGDSNGSLKFDAEKFTLSGSFDRFPANKGYLHVVIKATNAGFGGTAEEVAVTSFDIEVKGVAPTFKTAKIDDFKKGDSTGNHKISITGTQPMNVKAYITRADVKKIGAGAWGTNSIDIEVTEESGSGNSSLPAIKKADDTGPTFTMTKGVDKDDKKITVLTLDYKFDAQKFSLSNLPITISLDNGTGKNVIKVFKVNVEGDAPVWASGDNDPEEVSKDLVLRVPVYASGENKGKRNFAEAGIKLNVSGDNPIKVNVSPAKKDGFEAKVTSTDGVYSVTIKDGGAEQKKESKTVFTLTATNETTKKKAVRKVTIVTILPPTITTTTEKALTKEVEFPKTISLKVAATGTKPITWHYMDAAPTDVTPVGAFSTQKELLDVAGINALGLSLDKTSGTLKGTPLAPTSDDSHAYKPVYALLVASNDAGQAATVVKIGVKGKKPTITTKVITLNIEATGDDDLSVRSNIPTTDTTAFVKWKVNTQPKGYSLTIADDEENRNFGKLSGADTIATATKGQAFKVSADNVGTSVIGNVKLIVRDKAPEFDPDEYNETAESSNSQKVTKPVTIALVNGSRTGDTAIKWTITTKPSGKITAAIKPASNGESATITFTIPKGFSSKDVPGDDTTFETYCAVTATNTSTGASATAKVNIAITPYDAGGNSALPAAKDALPETETALPEAETETETDELTAGEGTVTYGSARTETALTQAERRAIAEGGYIIAAILPEITTDESGLYDLNAVSLDEAAPVDAELVWFAFPRNAEPSDDDAIAEFYDEAGAEIFAVPESRKVVPAPWLEADVTYAPVIAVKAPVAGGAKDSLDDAQEGDIVTEKAIEEAAEAPAE